MNSSKKNGRQILGVISASRAEALLSEWANLSGPWPLKGMSHDALVVFGNEQRYLRRRYKDFLGDSDVIGHPMLRDMLRQAWGTSDMRQREWLCFRFRDTYALMVRRANMEPDEICKEDLAVDVAGPRFCAPPITAIEAALVHFQHEENRTRRCSNAACASPFFFATKKGQRFCSVDCAIPVQREAKRKWWEQNRGRGAKGKRGKGKVS